MVGWMVGLAGRSRILVHRSASQAVSELITWLYALRPRPEKTGFSEIGTNPG